MKRKISVTDILIIAVLAFWALIILYPFYNSLVISLVPQEVYITKRFLLYPEKLDLSTYGFLFKWKAMLTAFKVTTIITVLGTLYNILLTVFTAYAFTKKIPGYKFFTILILMTMYLQGGLIPYYMLIKGLGLRDTLAVMIIPTGINIMYMLIMRSYFLTLPQELEESAKMDGAGDMYILFRIILPLCTPMLATIGLYYAVDRWNEWWLGMLFVRKPDLLPLQYLIRNMLSSSKMITQAVPNSAMQKIFPTGIQMAAVIVSMAPILFVYPFLQKYFVKGLTLGSVKM